MCCPLNRSWSNDRDFFSTDRRRGDKSDERFVLVIENSGFDLNELGLEHVFNGLHLDAMPAYLDLRVDSAEEVYALCLDIDFAFIPGAVEAAELRMPDELLGGLLRQVSIATHNVHSADAKLSNLSVGQWA